MIGKYRGNRQAISGLVRETEVHRDNMIGLIQALQNHFADDPRVCVSGNLMMYYVRGDKRRHVSPDVFVVHGLLRRRAAAVRLERVGAVELEQTIPGRLLGYGTILAGDLEIRYVPRAVDVCGQMARHAG